MMRKISKEIEYPDYTAPQMILNMRINETLLEEYYQRTLSGDLLDCLYDPKSAPQYKLKNIVDNINVVNITMLYSFSGGELYLSISFAKRIKGGRERQILNFHL